MAKQLWLCPWMKDPDLNTLFILMIYYSKEHRLTGLFCFFPLPAAANGHCSQGLERKFQAHALAIKTV
jgi:hypothetical protein